MRIGGTVAVWFAVVLLPSCSRPIKSFFSDSQALTSSPETDNGSRAVAEALQGDWELVAASVNDDSGFMESAVGQPTGKIACTFDNGVLTKWGGRETRASIRIDATKQPMWIDVSWPEGGEQKGVFSLSQDSLELLLSKGERIENLAPGKLDEHYVAYHFKRIVQHSSARVWP